MLSRKMVPLCLLSSTLLHLHFSLPVQTLRKAMEGWGTNEKDIVKVIASKSRAYLQVGLPIFLILFFFASVTFFLSESATVFL